jgi:hypothetical protein
MAAAWVTPIRRASSTWVSSAGLPERRQAHRVGPVRIGHVPADFGDLGRDVRPLTELADTVVVAADELDIVGHPEPPFWRSQASTSASPRVAALA